MGNFVRLWEVKCDVPTSQGDYHPVRFEENHCHALHSARVDYPPGR